MDCSLPGSSVHRISQVRILEWVAIFFSRGVFATQISSLCLLHWQADSLSRSGESKFLGKAWKHVLFKQRSDRNIWSGRTCVLLLGGILFNALASEGMSAALDRRLSASGRSLHVIQVAESSWGTKGLHNENISNDQDGLTLELFHSSLTLQKLQIPQYSVGTEGWLWPRLAPQFFWLRV